MTAHYRGRGCKSDVPMKTEGTLTIDMPDKVHPTPINKAAIPLLLPYNAYVLRNCIAKQSIEFSKVEMQDPTRRKERLTGHEYLCNEYCGLTV